MKLSRIGGAALGVSLLVLGTGAFAVDVVTETTVAPTAPVVTEQHRSTTTTTTTGPAISEQRVLTHDEKERLEDRAEKRQEFREKMRDADKEYRENVRDAVKDAHDDDDD